MLWALVFLCALVRVTQSYPDRVPMVAIVALHVFPPLLFALIHGELNYGIGGIGVFIGLCHAGRQSHRKCEHRHGLSIRALSLYGCYGPTLLEVLVLLGLAHIWMDYLSWTLGVLIAGGSLARLRVFTTPLIAAFVVVAY